MAPGSAAPPFPLGMPSWLVAGDKAQEARSHTVPAGNTEHPGPILAQMVAPCRATVSPHSHREYRASQPQPGPGDALGCSVPSFPSGMWSSPGQVTECRRLYFEVLLFHVTCSPRAWVSPARPGPSQRCAPNPSTPRGKATAARSRALG